VSTVPALDRSEVEIVADGSCLGNPGPGGWACILRCGERERVLQGNVPDTTNNRMELVATIEGLRALKRACQVTVLTDSQYVRRGITEFLPRWKTNGWQSAAGKAIANRGLWEELDELAGYHHVIWVHVRGHAGHPDHERCDALANSAARTAAGKLPRLEKRNATTKVESGYFASLYM
jgi:ribonuclease HI